MRTKEMKVREYLKEYTLLFDGGMGTYYSQRNHSPGTGCELASISQPELIEEIHREYLEAGCRALKTNTFGANRISFQGDEELVWKTVHAAWEAAAKAAADYDAFVFADIGPISSPSGETEVFEEYRFVADCFLEQGAENFLFETNANTDGLKEITLYIREKAPEAFIIVSFAVQADGFSRDGILAADLLADMRAHGRADALGLNCICGARHMLNLVRELDHEGMTLALMPNAGYPTVIGNRTFYDGDPRYFAEQMREMAAEGAMILGRLLRYCACTYRDDGAGSCGTGAGDCCSSGKDPAGADRRAFGQSFLEQAESGGKGICGRTGSSGGRQCGEVHERRLGAEGSGLRYHYRCRLPYCKSANGFQSACLQNPAGAEYGCASPYDLPGPESERHQSSADGALCGRDTECSSCNRGSHSVGGAG